VPGALGRIVPPDWQHVEKFPLTALTFPVRPTPAVIGVHWYDEFDNPEQDSQGHWWIARDGRLTKIRAGHCVCLKERGAQDLDAWWDFYDQGAEGACLTAGTLIEMADGSHRPIEDVRLLERVRTAEGHEGVVLQTHVRFHADGLVRMRLRGLGEFRATPEHPVLTRSGYVPVGELRLGDEVRLPGVLSGEQREIRTAEWLSEREQRVRVSGARWAGVAGRGAVSATIAAAPERIELTPTFGRIVGLWLAEGTTTANKLVWSFGGHERDTLAAELMELLVAELRCQPRLQVRGNGSLAVVVYGKHWRMLFERMFSRGPYEKTLPGALASGPPDFLRAVFDGWMAGDGHRRRERWHGVTVSKPLAFSMYRIAQGLGMAPTLRFSPGRPNAAAATRRGRWDLEFGDGQQAVVDEGGAWRKVTALEHEEWAGHVFNLHVDGDNSYAADGVAVHNCVGFGISRLATHLNKKLYDGRWLYHEAQKIDSRPGENYVGTTVRAGLDILRKRGHRVMGPDGVAARPDINEGIIANRWAQNIEDVLRVLGYAGLDYVDIMNSWGRAGYPHLVRMPATVLDRLRREEGEIGLVTDR
jgi:intein/homing endonuclease